MDGLDLQGVVDIHVHTGPDAFRERMYDDLSLAEEGIRHGARALMLKSHQVCTADRAQIANQLYAGRIRLLGGLALNEWTGGLNPAAVEVALGLRADIIWLPTLSSLLDHRAFGQPGGIAVTENGRVAPALEDILRLLADADTAALACGHCTAAEALIVSSRARELGVKRVIINHPALYRMSYTLEEQRRLLEYGVWFERCYGGSQRPLRPHYTLAVDENIRAIRALGTESTILATDLGGKNDVAWADGMKDYLRRLREAGFTEAELRQMACENPARALALD